MKDYLLSSKKINAGSANELITNQNYKNIADAAHGYNGVSDAITQYNNLVSKGSSSTNSFIESISKSNPVLAQCMKHYSDGSMSIGNYAVSLAGSTIKTFALQAATTALNAAMSMGISVIASLAIGGLTKLFDGLIETNAEYLEKQRAIIDNSNEIISANQSEIDELEKLKTKLNSVKDSKTDLAALSEDLNSTLGDGSSILLEEANGYDVLNAKIQRSIDLKKEEQEQANEDKGNALYNSVLNTEIENAGFGSQISFSQLKDYRAANDSKSVQEHFDDLLSEAQADGETISSEDDYSELWREALENVKNDISTAQLSGQKYDDSFDFGSSIPSTEELKDYFDATLPDMHEALADYINADGLLTADEKTSIVDNMFMSGTKDFNELAGALQQLDSNSENLNGLWSQYYDSLKNDTAGDEDVFYDKILKNIDAIKQAYPEASDALDNYFNYMSNSFQEKADDFKSKGDSTIFSEAFNSESFSESAKALKELAISGEIRPEVLTSTKAYRQLLEDTGLTAEEACKKINEFSLGNTSLGNIMGQIQSDAQFIDKINNEISDNNTLSFSTLQSMASQFPSLENYIKNYISGTAGSQEELLNQLNSLYQTDITNYSEYYKAKTGNDQSWWSNYIKSAETWIRWLPEQYNLDLTDYSTYLTAKAALEDKIEAVRHNYSGTYTEEDVAKLTNIYNSINSAFNNSTDSGEIPLNFGLDTSSKEEEISSASKAFDWIETKISRLSDLLDSLKTKSSDTYSSWESRNTNLAKAITKTNDAILLQEQAYSRYMAQADAIGLSDTYKSLIQEGSLNITDISDSDLSDKISEYESWYDKALECVKTQEDLKSSINELNQQKFDDIQSQYDTLSTRSKHYQTMLQSHLDLLEMQGLFANESYYTGMSGWTLKQISDLKNEKAQLQQVLNGITSGTEAWSSMYSEILSIDEEIATLSNDITSFNNSVRSLNWEIFKYLEESLNRITDETDYLLELMSNKDLFDSEGSITEYGTASIGLHAAAYDVYRQQAQDYYEEVQDLQKQLTNGAGKDVLEQYNAMVDAHQDAIQSAENEKQAILDLIEDGYNSQLDALQSLIDKKKEALNTEKSLYDYQKNIKEKTDNIASLEKQQTSYASDDSEETMSKIQQIKIQLEEAKADLKEAEYEQYLSDTESMLDTLASDYEVWMNSRLDNSDALLGEIIAQLQTEGTNILDTLDKISADYGTSISSSLETIFGSETPFSSSLSSIPGKLENISTSVTGTGNAIKELITKVAGITGTTAENTNAGPNTGNSNNSGGSTAAAPQTFSATGASTANNAQNGASSLDSILVSKKDYYPKNKLNINTSIVDRLKKYDKDSSWSARSLYWSKLFPNAGAYTGSATQNIRLLNYLKSNGYKSGTSFVSASGYHWTQENGEELIIRGRDGAILTPLVKGDGVLNSKATQNFYKFMNNPDDLISAIQPNLDLNADYTNNSPYKSHRSNMNVGDISINLPNVTNYTQFRNELVKDNDFEKSMLIMVNNAAMGKSTSGKVKYCI